MFAFGLALLLQVAPEPPAVPAPSPSPEAFAQTETEYRVGVGDVLDVMVFGSAELSRTAPIQPSGAIAMPLLGDIAVSGLTVAEVQRKVATLLERDYLVNPQVEVKVREYQSQFVFVVGEVNRPGRQALRGTTRLLDALLEAGGFNPRASGEVLITRPEAGEPQSLRIRLSGPSPTPQDMINLRVPLRHGDVVTAIQMSYVTVQGEVVRAGRYPVEGELTVSGAIALAGGLSRFGSNKVEISRLEPGGPRLRKIIKVDLKAISNGKAPDILVQGNDTIVVSRRLF